MNEQIINWENIRYNLFLLIADKLISYYPMTIVIESSQHPEHLADWRQNFLINLDERISKSYQSARLENQLSKVSHVKLRPTLLLRLDFPDQFLEKEKQEKSGIYRHHSQAEQQRLALLLTSVLQGPSLFTSWKSDNSVLSHKSSVEES